MSRREEDLTNIEDDKSFLKDKALRAFYANYEVRFIKVRVLLAFYSHM